MIAEIMPADYCDVLHTPTTQEGFSCLADVIEHNQRKRLEFEGLPKEDVEEIINIRKTRNMKKMVDLCGLLVDPEGTVAGAMPDMCEEVKQQTMSDPGFIQALNQTINSQMQAVKTIFHTDITNHLQMKQTYLNHLVIEFEM